MDGATRVSECDGVREDLVCRRLVLVVVVSDQDDMAAVRGETTVEVDIHVHVHVPSAVEVGIHVHVHSAVEVDIHVHVHSTVEVDIHVHVHVQSAVEVGIHVHVIIAVTIVEVELFAGEDVPVRTVVAPSIADVAHRGHFIDTLERAVVDHA